MNAYVCANDKCANFSIRFVWDNADEIVACRQCGETMTRSGQDAPKRGTK